MTTGALIIALLAMQQPASAGSVPVYEDLGNHHYAITAATPAVQAYFDQGLRLYYAFNHAEAIRSFRAAQSLDPGCAMCFWGEALALGPNINMPMDEEAAASARVAIQRAQAVAARVSEREQALIAALAVRYTPGQERAALDSAYAKALATVVERYPADPEAAVLHAESLMLLRPWNYWTKSGEPQSGTAELIATLERVLDNMPNHPGACHFYIHAVEEVHPEWAVPCAERLASLMPGAGHLVHMPAHIYIRVGRYLDAIRANEHAVHADESYIRDQRPDVGIYTAGYYPHNYDFLAFAAMMAGRDEQAIQAADQVAAVVPAELIGAPGMEFLEHYITRSLQIRVRFARWEEILARPAPAAQYVHARGIRDYAQGRALLAGGDFAAARAALQRVRAAADAVAEKDIQLDFNPATDVMRIAAHVLAGRIASAEGRHELAAEELRAAVAIEDEMVYGEPPEWSVPVRQDLGAVLLAAGDGPGAEQAFREELKRFPDNVWSLAGLEQALHMQQLTEAAQEVAARLHAALGAAGVQAEAVGWIH